MIFKTKHIYIANDNYESILWRRLTEVLTWTRIVLILNSCDFEVINENRMALHSLYNPIVRCNLFRKCESYDYCNELDLMVFPIFGQCTTSK